MAIPTRSHPETGILEISEFFSDSGLTSETVEGILDLASAELLDGCLVIPQGPNRRELKKLSAILKLGVDKGKLFTVLYPLRLGNIPNAGRTKNGLMRSLKTGQSMNI